MLVCHRAMDQDTRELCTNSTLLYFSIHYTRTPHARDSGSLIPPADRVPTDGPGPRPHGHFVLYINRTPSAVGSLAPAECTHTHPCPCGTTMLSWGQACKESGERDASVPQEPSLRLRSFRSRAKPRSVTKMLQVHNGCDRPSTPVPFWLLRAM